MKECRIKGFVGTTVTLWVDVMVDGEFCRQIPYRHCQLYPKPDMQQVRRYVKDNYPSLASKRFTVAFTTSRVH